MSDQLEHAGDVVWIRLDTLFQVGDDRVVEKAVAISLDLGVLVSQLREMAEDHAPRQPRLAIIAVFDDGGRDSCPPEPFRLHPVPASFRCQRLDAVSLKVPQRTKTLLEL